MGRKAERGSPRRGEGPAEPHRSSTAGVVRARAVAPSSAPCATRSPVPVRGRSGNRRLAAPRLPQ